MTAPHHVSDPARRTRWGDLRTRAISGLVMIVLAVGTARLGGDWFILFWLFAATAVLWEWQRLVDGPRVTARTCLGAVALAIIALAAHRAHTSFPGLTRFDLEPLVEMLVAAAGIAALLGGPTHRWWAAGGILYAGLLLLACCTLRFSFPFGTRSIFWLFATVWSTDVFAYLGGRLIGGPKLWTRISPSKTWSGTLVGTLAGAGIGTLVAIRDLPQPYAVLPIFVLSLFASLLSQAGDAGESAMKRRYGVKDSSQLIPGHGGAMDRLDGFVFAAVFAMIFGFCRNLGSIALGLLYWT